MPTLPRAQTRNIDFNLGAGEENADGARSWTCDSIQCAVLMDIRDELQRLNRLLACARFMAIPATLRAIQRNTKPKPKQPRKPRKRVVAP